MKIIVVGTIARSVTHFRLPLLRRLADEGHTVTVVATGFTEAERKLVQDAGVQVLEGGIDRTGLNPFADLQQLWFLFRLFCRQRPDVVLCYFAKPAIFGTLAAFFARVPRRVAMIEGLGYFFTRRPSPPSARQRLLRVLQVRLYRIALPRAHAVVFLNPDDQHELVEQNRVSVRQSVLLGGIGVELERFRFTQPPTAGISFLFVGRLLVEKGINEFLSAAERVKKSHPQARFVVAGGVDADNPGGVRVDRLKRLHESGVVEYLGRVNNIEELMRETSVFVLPSYREGVPMSGQEAAASGRAILTSDVPGCRETVIHGETGYLIQPFDVAGLAQRMVQLVETPSLVSCMGEKSRKLAERKFDVHEVNERLCHTLFAQAWPATDQ